MKLILVIEDEAAIRTNITKILQHHQFTVVQAQNGAEGIQWAKHHLPDLIICDIMMPDVSGYEVLATIRADQKTAAIPFIFLSAKSDRSDIRQGMNLGADDYLTKPFSKDELIDAVKARLKKQAAIVHSYRQVYQSTALNLLQSAYIDTLTKLPNRILLRFRLRDIIAQAQYQNQLVGVLCINLARFSLINSNFGAQTGDRLLQAVADRLQHSLGHTEIVARIGADEFCVAAIAQTESELVALTQAAVEALNQPYFLEGQCITAQVNIGVSMFPAHADQTDKLLTHADTARRWSRHQGDNFYQFYSPTWDAIHMERRSLEADLRLALQRAELRLDYQPQVDAKTGQMVGLEALVRWQHATRGWIFPNLFIPIAEETDLIIPIGTWILETACREIKQLQTATSFILPLKVSVNLSARQFRQKNLVHSIATILQRTQFDPHLLEIEITETSVMENIETAIATLRQLKELGINISVDDFGTGYSSLNYLRRLPIDGLKIDRSFIVNVNDNRHDAAVTQAIIEMAKSLNLKVVAEGVDKEAQLNFLQQHGCHLIQGHFYSKAFPIEDIQKLLIGDRGYFGTRCTLEFQRASNRTSDRAVR